MYNIEYIKTAVNHSHFLIDGHLFKFTTKSKNDIIGYLEDMRINLQTYKRFENFDDLKSDSFKVLEYFSVKEPELVEEYFSNRINDVVKCIQDMQLKNIVTISRVLRCMANVCLADKDYDI